jgi:tyrosyl-tRNA synthetase
MLSAEEVRANAETYMRQFFKVVDEKRAEIVWQSQWFGGFALADVIKLTSRFTVAQMLARDDFAKRHAEGRPIVITEFLYPLLQAYDSVAIEADVELGGTDQKFNLLLARELQQAVGQRPQQVVLVPLLLGTDGKIKMSKSQGNYIAVEDVPNEMYGKVMSIPDDLILQYFELVTDVPDEELEEFRRKLAEQSVNPMVLKQRLAREIVAQFHSPEAAQEAEEHFDRVFRRQEAPEEVREVQFTKELWDKVRPLKVQAGFVSDRDQSVLYPVLMSHLLVEIGLAKSLSEAKRLIKQGAVDIDGEIFVDDYWDAHLGSIIRVGKRRFVKLVSAKKEISS